jgi:hypothetical protein
MVIGDRIPATKRSEDKQMPLTDDVDALSDDEYQALLDAVEENSEPCPAAVPADVLADSLARLDASDGE